MNPVLPHRLKPSRNPYDRIRSDRFTARRMGVRPTWAAHLMSQEFPQLLRRRRREQLDVRSYSITLQQAFERAAAQCPLISVDKRIMAGAPCVRGTRIPVYMIIDALEHHGNVEGVSKSYPHLTAAQIQDAILFAKLALECQIGNET